MFFKDNRMKRISNVPNREQLKTVGELIEKIKYVWPKYTGSIVL